MGFSEIPTPAVVDPGNDLPLIDVRPPGPGSRTWLTRLQHRQAPMGPQAARGAPSARGMSARAPLGTIVFHTAQGSNVTDVDGNRYVDLAGGFGSLLLGHSHEAILRVLQFQGERLLQAMGDVHPSGAKIGLLERLAELHPARDAQVILAQSGSDALTAALKTASLATGKPGAMAFRGSYHGLGYGPLAACGLRESYRAPFLAQLNPSVRFAPYPSDSEQLDASLSEVRAGLAEGNVGAVLVEPILGRGGIIVPPASFLRELRALAHEAGALLIADEIWTGLGRSGQWWASIDDDFCPDIVCLGKGLGGGLPISACLAPADIMRAWSRPSEVIHTSTFAGAPLACATALATLDILSRQKLVERARTEGARFLEALRTATAGTGILEVRGQGLMIGLDATGVPGGAGRLRQALLERGYITSTGGGARDVLVLTPPLNVGSHLLDAFTATLLEVLEQG